MSDPLVDHEINELAVVTQVPVDRIGYLAVLGADDLHILRKAVTIKLHERYSADYRRLGLMVRFMPKRIAARIGVKLLPPRILGRAAGPVFHSRTGRTLAKMSDIPPEVIAEAAPFMDPRTIGRVAAEIPTSSRELVNGIMDELIRRDDLATIDRLLLYMGDDADEPHGPAAATHDRM
ncbi:hypothetical protein O6P37_10825 [Mycobacterium sp. CPCC 205372]|uniref:Uncharacterized protein n=1 Tax=Mycobacterium hippophais TaxID=3016340 RepID=A0ABT4PS96_9MYCO|nr:hypothetical protein [Mycobacterium hippophais]MCZ8379359.1 hypothetical protein [Mycobacterium hippophais]